MTIREKLENASGNSNKGPYVLRLFVAGVTPKSTKAIKNIKKIIEDYGVDCELDIIDIYQQPILAKDGRIIAAPTLIKELPLPVRKFIGDMSDFNKLIVGLDLVSKK
jgi:circadian clock protein KaiB